MKKELKLFAILFMILSSCVSSKKELPIWAEIKPSNTDKEIFFVYGPSDSRESVRNGLYKEISEYFGVKVSSVDKFVKNVTYENGKTDISQSKESLVDVASREKGLDSIQIREIWSDEINNRWCILASIDSESEKLIRDQVAIDVEKERVLGILNQGEYYSDEAEKLYSKIEMNLELIKKTAFNINLSLEKIPGISNNSEIIEISNNGLLLSSQIEDNIKECESLTNEIKILYKKNELLNKLLVGNEIALLELDFFILKNSEILLKAEERQLEISKIEPKLSDYKVNINRELLNAELNLLDDEENKKQQLITQLTRIKENDREIQIALDEIKLLFGQSEDILRNLKQISYSEVIDRNTQLSQIKKFLDDLDKIEKDIKVKVDLSYSLKHDIGNDYTNSVKSKYINNQEINDIKDIYENIDSKLSLIEIYKDKNLILYTNGKKIFEDLQVKNVIDIRLDSFVSNLSDKLKEKIDLTIGEFTIEDSHISSSFSLYLKEKIFSIVGGRSNFYLVNYKSVTDYFTSMNINPSNIYKVNSANVDNIVNNIIYGNYWINDGDVELKIYLKNISSNRILYSESILLPEKSIPEKISIIPSNYNQTLLLESKFSSDSVQKGFEVWPDKGNGSTYIDGESMVINMITPITGYVKIYHISADNELTLVFPNKFDKNNKLEAGTHYTIGDSSYPFSFKLGKPYGTESLKALFSLDQFDDLITDSYEGEFLYSGVRGINIESRLSEDIKLDSLITTSHYTITK